MKTYDEILRLVCKINFSRVKNKGENMNNYSVDDAITKKVASAYDKDKEKNELDGVIGTINAINDSFGLIEIPDYEEPDFSRLDVPSKSGEEIEKEARDALADYRNTELSSLDSDFESKRDSLEQNKEDLKENKISTLSTISSTYNKARENASNDALRRGLARSSIIVSVLDAFSKDEIEDINRVEKDYVDSLNAIDFEINALDAQRKQAINDFDIAYAVKLNDKINILTSEFEKKQSEIIKYNNEIAEKEKEYQDNYNKLVADIKEKNITNASKQSELVSKYGTKALANYTKNQVFAVLDNYLAGKDKSKRIELLTSSGLKDALGANYDEAYKRYVG